MMLFKKILLKILRPTKTKNVLAALLKKGNIQFGSNCIFESAYIEILHTEKNCNNIIIGNNCNIMGSLSIYAKNAKIIIGDGVFIGPGTKVICYDEIRIENGVMISWDCTIMDTNSHSLKSKERQNDVLDWNKGFAFKDWSNVEYKKIHINEKSWVGFKSIILKGVILGKGTIVASGSVVTKNTDDYTIIGGNPARFLKNTE